MTASCRQRRQLPCPAGQHQVTYDASKGEEVTYEVVRLVASTSRSATAPYRHGCFCTMKRDMTCCKILSTITAVSESCVAIALESHQYDCRSRMHPSVIVKGGSQE